MIQVVIFFIKIIKNYDYYQVFYIFLQKKTIVFDITCAILSPFFKMLKFVR
jgi:Cu2+-containing amine oxidase